MVRAKVPGASSILEGSLLPLTGLVGDPGEAPLGVGPGGSTAAGLHTGVLIKGDLLGVAGRGGARAGALIEAGGGDEAHNQAT